MPTVISVLTPNTQFIYKSTANTLLSPLVNDTFTVEGTPQIWLCDSSNKGSLHTLDYSGNPSEIIIIPNSPPDTTTNTQWFMYYKNVGGSWIASSGVHLPWVTYQTQAVSGPYTSSVPLDGQFLWSNYTTPAPPATTIAPSPLTLNTGISASNRLHYASICCAFNTTTTRSNALFSCGASLISPNYVLAAHHCKPERMWFQQEDGTEISRDRVSATQIGTSDMSVMKLNSPIHTITPARIVSNSGVYGASKIGYLREIGGRLTTLTTQVATATSQPSIWLSKMFYTTNTGAALQDGNSGHPYVVRINSIPFLLGLVHEGTTTVGQTYSTNTLYITNIANQISAINAVLAADNECLNTVTLTITP